MLNFVSGTVIVRKLDIVNNCKDAFADIEQELMSVHYCKGEPHDDIRLSNMHISQYMDGLTEFHSWKVVISTIGGKIF